MKKNSKKLIALLSVCCVATAAAAFAGCGKTDGKSAYEIAKQQGWFSGTEEEFKALTHSHTYGDIVEVIAPTGESDGLGYKVCSEDGHKEYVVLAKLAGVIPSNPIEIAVGETKSVTLNTYEGVNSTVSGMKNVMYFKTTVDKTGYVAMPTNVPEGVGVEYAFFSDAACENMMYSRNVWVNENEEGATKDVYVAAYFYSEVEEGEEGYVAVPATVEVTAQFTDLSNEEESYNLKIKHTITLSQGTAEELKVYYTWGGEYSLTKDGAVEEGSIGDYKPFAGTNTATVWLEPGDWTFAIEGLTEGFCVADESEMIIDLPDDGSKDKDCEYTITIGKTYDYTFTVTDPENAVIENAAVVVLDENEEEVAYGMTDAQGKVTITLGETKDADGVLGMNYTVVASNLGFGLESPAPIALAADTLAVTIQAVEAVVDDWATDGTTYMVFGAEPVAYATVTLAEAGNYDVVLSSTNNMFSAANFMISVNDQIQTVGDPSGWDLAYELKATFAMNAGVNQIVMYTSHENLENFSIVASVVAATTGGGDAGAPVGNVLELDTAYTVEEEGVYTFTAPAAGTYTFTPDSNEAALYTQDAWDSWGNPFAQGGVGTLTLAEGETVTIIPLNNGNGSFTLTITAGEGNALVLDTPKTVSEEGTYTFTAAVGGVYVFTPSSNEAALYTQDAWDSWGNPFAQGGAGTLTLAEGETVTIIPLNNGNGDFTITVTLQGNAGGR